METLLLLLGLVFTFVEGQMYDRLYDNLLKNYNPETIPMKSADTPVVVKFGVSLINVRSIDTDTGDGSFDVWIQYSWVDGRLTWSKRKYNKINAIRFKPDRIWRPDVECYDGEMKTKEYLAVISSNGHIDHIPKTLMSLRCDVTNYTEDDTVTCSTKFGSWTYDGQKIDLELKSEDVDFSDLITGRWVVESSSLVRDVKHYSCCPEPYPDVTLTLVLRDNKKSAWSFF